MEIPKSTFKDKRFSKHKWLLKIGVSILITTLLLLGFHLEANYKALNTSSYYTVVVDCGSTGTRVNVYEWLLEGNTVIVTNRDLPILLHSYPDNETRSSSLWKNSCQYHCLQTEPGLDKFVNDSLGVRQKLEPLIVWAGSLVPNERHGETPVFVLATAGLRRLAVRDSDRVLDDVEAVLKDHSFMYRKSWVRVLSGREEAYYGWVALNYKMGSFGNYPNSSPTLGVIDLGGSSLQIMAEVDGAVDEVHEMRSNIGSVEHQIVAYSFPAFGLNEAFDRTVLMLKNNQSLETTGNISQVRHPCLISTFVQNYTVTKKTELHSLRLIGEPDWEQCKKVATAATMNSSNSNVLPPTIGQNSQPDSFSNVGTGILNLTAIAHQIKRYHALSGFFFVYNKLNLAPKANLTTIWESGKQICSNLWTGSSNISDNPNYAGKFCFQVAYMASLIEYGLCLGDVEIVFGPGDVSWTLGAALVEGKFLWLNTSSHKAQSIFSTLKHVKVMSSPTLLFAVLLFLLFIVYCSQMKLPMLGRRASSPGISLPSHVRHRSI
ncbi:unnamed protein product [Lupinus luteus]|uniref:Apyrase n=1 Tax=Lupinus luteus TaxID=3873 RepID=A0AAV1Y9B3_LUPLU